MAVSRSHDLTEGSIVKHLVRYSIPVLMGYIFYQLYCVVDGIIAGKVLGSEALAAISAADTLSYMFINGGLGVVNGFGIVIAQAFGARHLKDIKQYFAASLVLWFVISFTTGIITGILAPQMLRLLNTPEEILTRSANYIRTRLFGLPILLFYNLNYYIFCCLGDSRTPFILQLFTNTLNAAMDVVCMMVFKLDTFGAGLSSIIACAVGCVLSVSILVKNFPELHIEKEDFAFDPQKYKKLLSTGLPIGLQTAIVAIGSGFYAQALNRLGTIYVAATAASNKIQMICLSIFDALQAFMFTFAGQNTGAEKFDRVKSGIRKVFVTGAVWSAICLGVTAIFGKSLTGIFISSSETQVISAAYRMTVIHAATYIFTMIVYTFRPAIQSVGFPQLAMISGVMEIIGRIIASKVFAPLLGFDGVILADCTAWFCAACFLVPCLVICIKKAARKAKAA